MSRRKLCVLGFSILGFAALNYLIAGRSDTPGERRKKLSALADVDVSAKIPEWLWRDQNKEDRQPGTVTANLYDSVPGWLWEKAGRVRNPYRKCQDLYPDADYRDPYPLDVKRAIKEHNDTYWRQPSVPKFFTKTGNEPDGYILMCCPAQVLLMMDIARLPWVKTVCEVGFNAGHSALTWLLAKPNTTVYSFDEGFHDYTRPMADYLRRKYPGRFEIVIGDSTKTLPQFISNNPEVKCDVMSIDGGHFYRFIIKDFQNFRRMANRRNLLHFDDYPSGSSPIREQEVGRAWEEVKDRGQLTEIFKCSFDRDKFYTHGLKGFALGHINIQ